MLLINTRKKLPRSLLLGPGYGKQSRLRRIEKTQKLEWQDAKEIKKDIEGIIKVLGFEHIDSSRIFCFRTKGSKSRSYARIWSMPKIFQTVLKTKPAYVIEVLSRHFDKLDEDGKKKVLIHELLHIPKNFSGALLPHRGKHKHLQSQVNQIFKEYKTKMSS